MKTAGLNIEGLKLGVSVMSRSIGMLSHVKSEEYALPADPVEHPAFIREVLLALKAEHGISGFSVGLELGLFAARIVELPFKGREDIANALAFELETQLPLPPEEYRYDFMTLSTSGASSTNLIFAIKRDRLAWLAECVEETGLKLHSVRCAQIEALNELLSIRDARHSLFVQRVGEGFHIIGLDAGKPVLFLSAHSLDEAVAKATEHAAAFKGLYVSGIPDLAPFAGLTPASVSYDLASLVAASDLRRKPIRLNFIPEALAPRRLDLFPYVAAGLAALCVLLYLTTSVVAYYKEKRALDGVNASLQDMEKASHELLQTRKESETILDKRRFLQEFVARSNRKIGYIRDLSTALPDSAWLVSLNIDGKGRVEIEGYAERTADIIGPLEHSGAFKHVEITAPVLLREGLERFSIRMEVAQ